MYSSTGHHVFAYKVVILPGKKSLGENSYPPREGALVAFPFGFSLVLSWRLRRRRKKIESLIFGRCQVPAVGEMQSYIQVVIK